MTAPDAPQPERVVYSEEDGFEFAGPWTPGPAEWVRADLYATLAAEKERLESERDERVKLSNQWMNCAAYYRQELTAAEARVRSLEEALRRIADWSFHDINEEGPSAANAMVNIAQEALSTREEGKT